MLNKFPSSFELENTIIGEDNSCYVIAEGGVNHFGEQTKAFRLIDLAINAQANCYKAQHYDVNHLISPTELEWRKRLGSKQLSNSEIYEQYQYCKGRGFTFLCTPHEEYALDFLEAEIDPPAYKIGSGEVNNHYFVAKVARLGKPLILSTGMYSLSEVIDTLRVIYENGAPPVAILHCVTRYPAPAASLNLKTIGVLKSIFSGPVGYSDHSVDEFYPLIAVALGAKIVEKHITLDRNVPNAQDWKASLDERSFPQFISKLRELETALGQKSFPDAEELKSKAWAAKSVTATKPILIDDIISSENTAMMRPGGGLDGAGYALILGKKASKEFLPGDQIRQVDVHN